MRRYQDIATTRRGNLRTIHANVGPEVLKKKLGMSRQQLHRLINVNSKTRIGDELARRIEKAVNYPTNWMDERHPDEQHELEEFMTYLESLQPERFKQGLERFRLALTILGLAPSESKAQDSPSPHDRNNNASTKEGQDGNPSPSVAPHIRAASQ